ncbi:MAG: hypothetical protein GY711_21115 [bacterium]|nr:hypothetical protein [bacterium]
MLRLPAVMVGTGLLIGAYVGGSWTVGLAGAAFVLVGLFVLRELAVPQSSDE